MTGRYQTVVVGGGAAGFSAVEAIVERGGKPLLIDAEDRPPYKRTKVSKSFAGGFPRNAFALQDEDWYRSAGVDLLTGRRVTSLDRDARTVSLDDGGRFGWDRLILATGMRPARPRLPVEEQDLFHYPITASAVERLHRAALRSSRALILGLGVLGVEIADQLVRMGLSVTMAGHGTAPMHHSLNQVASVELARVLRAGGVELRFHEEIAEVKQTSAGLVVTFRDSGRSHTYDLLVSAIGVEPNTDLAREAGLDVPGGIRVDRHLRTSDPDIYAAGDAARQPDGMRTHLWRHALHQGRTAGLNVCGGDQPYHFVPFRLKCTVLDHYFFAVGRPDPDELSQYEVREDRDGERYLCAYYREGRLSGLVMMGDEENQKRYLQAVIEGWSPEFFRKTFLR